MLLTCLFGVLFVGLLTLAAVLDYKTLEIPDQISAAIVMLALVEICLKHLSLFDALTGFAFGGIPVLIVALLTKEGIGGGDVKLLAAIGFFLGAEGALIAPLLGCIFFLLAAAFRTIRKKKSYVYGIAFAPAIAIGSTITYIIMQIGGNTH